MPLAMQAKLLRVLQEREIERVGGNETHQGRRARRRRDQPRLVEPRKAGSSGPTSTIGSTCCRSRSRRCARAATTSLCWCDTF